MNAITTAQASFVEVPFHDHQILAAQVAGQIRVPMKPLASTLGLPWEPQRKRIMRDEVLKMGASMMEVPSAGGVQQMLTLPADLLPGFLFTIDVARLKPELRERMHLFRLEAFKVLADHFSSPARREPVPVTPRPSSAPNWQELNAARQTAPLLIAQISTETRPAVRSYLYALLQADADRLGLPLPPLDQLGEGVSADALIARLVKGLETLTARKVRWNHAAGGSSRRFAIVLSEIEKHFRYHDVDVAIDDRLRAILATSTASWRVSEKTIKSPIARKPVLAIVIEAWPLSQEAGNAE